MPCECSSHAQEARHFVSQFHSEDPRWWLDLYHYKVNDQRRGDVLTIHECTGARDMHRRFSWAVVIVQQERTDWHATLAARGFDSDHFVEGAALVTIDKVTGKVVGRYAFKRAEGAPRDLPEALVFDDRRQDGIWDDLMTAVIPSRQPGSEAITFHGPLITGRVPEPSVFCAQVGYQRKGVTKEFYDQFPPDEYVTALDRVRRIHDLAQDEYAHQFQEEFLDNWDERTSFVLVSW
jgi:hypothetical protein